MISDLPCHIKKYAISHWYGQHASLLTILVNLLGLRLLIGAIPKSASNTVNYLLIILSLFILVWQVKGALRNTDQHIKATGDVMMFWTAYASIALVLLFTVLHTLDLLADPPKITEASLRNKPLPTLSADKTTVHLQGELDFSINTDLLTMLKRHPTLSTVELDSGGGLIYAARALAYTIEKHQLNTHVEKQCNSACTLAFMAGKHRTLGKQGKVGFHQYKFIKNHPLRTEKATDEQNRDRRYLATRGISTEFLDQLYQSGHQNIWQPDHTTLLNAGILTRE